MYRCKYLIRGHQGNVSDFAHGANRIRYRELLSFR